MLFVQLIVVQLIIFGALILVLRHVLTRHIGSASSHLDELNQESNRKLQDAKKKMEEANTYYDGIVVKSREEGERLKQELVKEGVQAKEELLEQARKLGDEITDRAKHSAEMLMLGLEQKIDERAIDKTQSLIRELLEGRMTEETHGRWVKELLGNGFDGLSRLSVSEQVHEARVISAFPLKTAEKTALLNELNAKLGRTIQLKEEVDPELILGLRLTLDTLVIDGSLDFKIRELIRNARRTND
jgi:F0F1-type ATP synthase membrane subunit b/b'